MFLDMTQVASLNIIIIELMTKIQPYTNMIHNINIGFMDDDNLIIIDIILYDEERYDAIKETIIDELTKEHPDIIVKASWL